MQPVTPAEKIRAFERVRSCASSLIHDGIISEIEFRILINRAVQSFGSPLENQKIIDSIPDNREWVKYRGMNIHPSYIDNEFSKACTDAFVDRVEKNRSKESKCPTKDHPNGELST